jgi:chemotaxis response regulator CheB
MCVIAPGEHHLAIERAGSGYRTRLLRSPPVHHCRPAVDVLFRSAAEAAGPHVVAALMTGMGSDGAMGLGIVRKAGGTTIAEHESTCVVYGMPRAAIELGVVDQVVPLPRIAAAIVAAASAKPSAQPRSGRRPDSRQKSLDDAAFLAEDSGHDRPPPHRRLLVASTHWLRRHWHHGP